MKRIRFIALFLFLTITIHGCVGRVPEELQNASYEYPAEELSNITVEIYNGTVTVAAANDNVARINVFSQDLENVRLHKTESDLSINEANRGDLSVITLDIPNGKKIEIKTFSGNVEIESLVGIITVKTSAGNIYLNSFVGDAQLWAGRGDVSVWGGDGNVVIIGEHGTLTVEDFVGDVSMTTIMGSTKLIANKSVDGEIRLEADHGPIEVELPESADLDVIVNTNSGLVTCLSRDLYATVDGCEGRLGMGGTQMSIRTVSGNVGIVVVDE
ncbi:MAG: DUF4097 domain-containing protein [Chloroflexi bacterium]|nr:DUF4097 domain-containing protein [Chloroflexota bacterium]